MVQVNVCLLGAGFTGGLLYTTLAKYDSEAINDFQYSLDANQLRIYKEIIKERSNLYIQGLLIGTVVALVFLNMFKDQMGNTLLSCATSTIAMATSFFYYMLMPKEQSMLNVLRTQLQIKLWKKVHLEMQTRYWSGFLMGIAGYAFLSYGFLNKTLDLLPTDLGNNVRNVFNVIENKAKDVSTEVQGGIDHVAEALGLK